MSEMQNQSLLIEDEEDVIDLGSIEDYLDCIKNNFLQLLLIGLSIVAIVTACLNYKYMPEYEAKLTYAVIRSGDSGVDSDLAARLSSSIKLITSLKDFQDELYEGVDTQTAEMLEKMNPFHYYSQYTEKSNLFTINISSNNYKNTNIILERFREIYPEWAYESNGNLKLEEVDVSEATSSSQNPYSLLKFLLIGCAVGLVVCLGILVYYVISLETVRTETDMREIVGKGCMAQIPETKVSSKNNGKSQILLTNKHLDWMYRQAIQTVQTRAFQNLERKGQKILMVTSTIPQEGKTLTAVNIALACVAQGKKTILIDADLRNPSVEKTLGLSEKGKGLSDFLTERIQLEDFIIKKNNFSLITAGSKKTVFSKVVREKKLRKLMDYLREKYDCIIIDTPPSDLFSDAALISEFADGVIYVVHPDKPTKEQVRSGISPFLQNEKLIGYIFNRTTGTVLGYGRYGSYGYSRGYRYGSYGYSKYQHYIDPETSDIQMNSEDSL